MSATFACPHCGATYPVKPVLVGRPVRCTTCKNAFCLRADGVADTVDMPAPAPAVVKPATAAISKPAPPVPAKLAPVAPAKPAPKPATAAINKPPAQRPPANPGTSATNRKPVAIDEDDEDVEVADIQLNTPSQSKAAVPTPAPDGTSSSQSVRTRSRTDRLTAQQKEARRAMSATLATSMEAALKADSVKREADVEKKKSKSGAQKNEGSVGRIGPAVLTGEGVQDARRRRQWFLIGVGTVLSVALIIWLFSLRSPQRAAIEGFTAVVEGKRNRYGERVLAIQERAWLVALPPANVGVPPMIDMADARVGSIRRISLAGAKEQFTALKGLTLIDQPPAWVTPARISAVQAAWAPTMKEPAFLARARKIDDRIIGFDEWQDNLAKTGLLKEDIDIIKLLLRGRTQRSGENEIATKFFAGDVPDLIELATFRGRRGQLLVDRGQAYKPRDVQYEGQLLHFVGAGWPSEWKVLTISTSGIGE